MAPCRASRCCWVASICRFGGPADERRRRWPDGMVVVEVGEARLATGAARRRFYSRDTGLNVRREGSLGGGARIRSARYLAGSKDG